MGRRGYLILKIYHYQSPKLRLAAELLTATRLECNWASLILVMWQWKWWTTLFICCDPTRSRDRFRSRDGPSLAPYLALHPMGFTVPPCLRVARWALTPPFHPCSGEPGRFVFCGTVRRRFLPKPPPACIPGGTEVTQHRVLWCSDFPLPS
jgi:hypothetical protein